MNNSLSYVQPAPQPVVPEKRRYTLAQKLLALAVLLLGYFYIRAFLFSAAGLGRTLFVFLLLAVSAAYMAHARIRPNAAAVAAGVLTGLFSLVFVLDPERLADLFHGGVLPAQLHVFCLQIDGYAHRTAPRPLF